MSMNCSEFVKTLYFSAFLVAVVGFIMEAWDIKNNVPFSYWLTGALAFVTLLKFPYKICQGDLLPVMELLISLVAYVYLTYINIDKKSELRVGSIQLNLE